jgi:hypothetical protein
VFEHERACVACTINEALDAVQRLMSAGPKAKSPQAQMRERKDR